MTVCSGLASSQLIDSEKVINDVILVGSINNACSLAAVVSRCPALGVTMQTLLHELPQVLLLYWHWNTTWHSKKLSSSINPNSRTEELTCGWNIIMMQPSWICSLLLTNNSCRVIKWQSSAVPVEIKMVVLGKSDCEVKLRVDKLHTDTRMELGVVGWNLKHSRLALVEG